MVVVLLTMVGLAPSAAAGFTPAPTSFGYTLGYDQPTTYTATERDPADPGVLPGTSAGERSVDRWSYGEPVRPDVTNSYAYITYDQRVPLAQVENTAPTARAAGAVDGEISSSEPSVVAANAGDDVARLISNAPDEQFHRRHARPHCRRDEEADQGRDARRSGHGYRSRDRGERASQGRRSDPSLGSAPDSRSAALGRIDHRRHRPALVLGRVARRVG